MNNNINDINYEELTSVMPSCMMHQPNDETSTTILSDGTKVVSDKISDTYITELSNGCFSIVHCDHFGCKTEEDFERLNHECFVNMIRHLDEDELEKVRQINGVDAISDLFVFKPKKHSHESKDLSTDI